MKSSSGYIWFWRKGIGFLLPRKQYRYDEEYWKKYCNYDDTPTAKILLSLRMGMLQSCVPDPAGKHIVDVGIGSGLFVKTLRTFGYKAWGMDINPHAIRWLNERGWLWKEDNPITAMTFWDSLEHLSNPVEFILSRSPQFVLVSTPIYFNEQDCLHSKHFRPDEHLWYFTQEGLQMMMKKIGYSLLEENWDESRKAKRENIMSFAFQRI